VILGLLERQHGVCARAQLFALGLSRGAVDRRIERGRLRPVHRGVYALGHRALSAHGHWMAAVLAGGPGAVLSHTSAARLWELPARARGPIHVSLPRGRRPRRGLAFHDSPLPADERTALNGIPVTTAARTLLDLAAVLPRQRLEKAINEAEYRRLGDATPLTALVERYPRRRGTANLRAILDAGRLGENPTRSDLEDDFLDLLRRHGLPRPRTNVAMKIGGLSIEADCVWEEHRLIVELDGRDAHGTARAFEADRARDRRLQAAGWRAIRVTGRQLDHEPRALDADLRSLLGMTAG
jgi:very-short-patch-repair endonuclease